MCLITHVSCSHVLRIRGGQGHSEFSRAPANDCEHDVRVHVVAWHSHCQEEQHTSSLGNDQPVGLHEQMMGVWGPGERKHASRLQHSCAQEETLASTLADGQRCGAVMVGLADRGAVLQQQPSASLVAFLARDVQRRDAILVRMVHRSAALQQQLRARLVAFLASDVQRCGAVLPRQAHFSAVQQQQLNARLVAVVASRRVPVLTLKRVLQHFL